MTIIKPYFTRFAVCDECGDEAKIVVWNGVSNFDMRPNVTDLIEPTQGSLLLMKCQFEILFDVIRAAHQLTHHVEVVVIWTDDTKTYDMAELIFNDQRALQEIINGADEASENSTKH